MHAPVAMSAGAEFGAAVIAARNRALAQIVASGRRCKRWKIAIGAHFGPRRARSVFRSIARVASTPRRRQISKWFAGVAQKAHIGRTTRVILSEPETTNRGVLCLAPNAKKRSSHSFCSVLRCIRQSNSVSERCIKKTARAGAPRPFEQSDWQAGAVSPSPPAMHPPNYFIPLNTGYLLI